MNEGILSSFVYTPVTMLFGYQLLCFVVMFKATTVAYMAVPLEELCDESVELEAGSEASALLLAVAASGRPCAVSISVPASHQISLRVGHRDANNRVVTGRCPLRAVTESSRGVSGADLCGRLAFPPERFRGDRLTLVWLPEHNDSDAISHLLVTAVARGHVCNSKNYVRCQSRQQSKLLCVPQKLACDGYANCPYSADDESAEFCAHITELPYKLSGDTNVTDEASPESISDILTYYSPWGYLMLGMLITGVVLMLCGLWECCCRRHKPSRPAHPPTTVFIIQGSGGQVDAVPPETPEPPSYESLDQPPPYESLFPITKVLHTSEINSVSR